MPTYARISDLPNSGHCRRCGQDKPLAEMEVARRRTKIMLLYRCRSCGNEQRRGKHNTAAAREWRRRNRQSARDAARKYKESHREQCALAYRRYWGASLPALRVLRRMESRKINCTMAQARELLDRFGPAYPMFRGLTRAGQLAVRSIQHRSGVSRWDATLMVYDEWADEPETGYVLPATEQAASLPRGPGARARRNR